MKIIIRIFAIILLIVILIFLGYEVVHGYKIVRNENLSAEEKTPSNAAEAGNRICPVSGMKIRIGEEKKYEYEGIIYNFYSIRCVEEFKKNPEKYIDVLKRSEKIII